MKAVLKSDALAALSFGTDEIDACCRENLGEPVAGRGRGGGELAARAREVNNWTSRAPLMPPPLQCSRALLGPAVHSHKKSVRATARARRPHLARARVWNEKSSAALEDGADRWSAGI